MATVIGEAPRIVVHVNGSLIDAAYIVADKGIRIKIPEIITAAKIIGGLLCSYYAWHRDFLPAYGAILDFIAFKVFRHELKRNSR